MWETFQTDLSLSINRKSHELLSVTALEYYVFFFFFYVFHFELTELAVILFTIYRYHFQFSDVAENQETLHHKEERYVSFLYFENMVKLLFFYLILFKNYNVSVYIYIVIRNVLDQLVK